MRKEVAELLRVGKQENARIRIEAVVRENLMLQARPRRTCARACRRRRTPRPSHALMTLSQAACARRRRSMT